MHFLADVYVKCEECEGRRFNNETLKILFKDKSISDVLEMDVQQALEHFENIPKIRQKLQTLHDVGLDYLKLGQPSPTPVSEVIRVTRPAGGVAYLGQPPRPISGWAPGKTLPAKSLAPNSAAFVKSLTEMNVKHTRNGNWIELSVMTGRAVSSTGKSDKLTS